MDTQTIVAGMRRRAKAAAQQEECCHIALCGPTGLGKTELIFRLFFGRSLCRADRPAVVFLDGHGPGVDKGAIKCNQYGLIATGEARVDYLHDPRYGIGYGFFQPSDNPDPEVREAENRELISEKKSLLVRAEGKLDTQANPIIDEGLGDALSLLIHQKTFGSLAPFWDAFSFGTPGHMTAVQNCAHQRTKDKFISYAQLPPREKSFRCDPARRRIERLCSCVQFRKRCRTTIDLAKFINAGGILLVSGASHGDLSREDASLLLGMILLRIIQLARAGKLKRRVVLIVDEGIATKLLDHNVARALAEARKWGLQIVLIIQDVFSLPEDIRAAVLQNCKVMYVFQQSNPQAARLFAEKFAIPTYDPLRVKHTDYITRTVHDGYVPITTKTKSVTKDKLGRGEKVTEGSSTHFQAQSHEEQEARHQFYKDTEWITMKQKELMNLGVGQFELLAPGYVSKKPEYFTMLDMPCQGLLHGDIPLAKHKLAQALDQLKSLYLLPEEVCPEPTTTRLGRNARKRR